MKSAIHKKGYMFREKKKWYVKEVVLFCIVVLLTLFLIDYNL